MARIRTVKPEFWTDEKVIDLSITARLLFLGLLNFVDDEGRMAYSARKVKAQVFPADQIDTAKFISELNNVGMISVYQVDGKEYLRVKNFSSHQSINKPKPSTIPDEYGSAPVSLPECSRPTTGGKEGKGRERKGKERKGKEDDKRERADGVMLTDQQFAKLTEQLGEQTARFLDYFSAKKIAKGYTYDSDYHAMISWGLRAFQEDESRGRIPNKAAVEAWLKEDENA